MIFVYFTHLTRHKHDKTQCGFQSHDSCSFLLLFSLGATFLPHETSHLSMVASHPLGLQLTTDTFGTGLQGFCRSLTMKTHLKKRVFWAGKTMHPDISCYMRVRGCVCVCVYVCMCVCVCVWVCQHVGCVLFAEK